MAPNFRRSRPIHSQTSNLPGSRRPRTSKPIRREFAQGIQVARLRPQNKEAGGGQGSGDGSGGRNPGDKVPGDRPPCRADLLSPQSDAKAVECARVPEASRRCGTQKLEPLKRPGRYHQETRGGGAGFRAAGWVGGREPRKQGRPPRPPRDSPADMPSVGKWRRLTRFPGGFDRAGVGGWPIATAIATSGYLSGTGTGRAGGSARSGRGGRRTGRGSLDGRSGNLGPCVGSDAGARVQASWLSSSSVAPGQPPQPPGGGCHLAGASKRLIGLDRENYSPNGQTHRRPTRPASGGPLAPLIGRGRPSADAGVRLRGRRHCPRTGGWDR